ncbi:MAG: peptide ABC transporter substrate-binding protein [Capsulimonadaceae bacterium]|nr:peptide ABC transporter substrate-binding protein [Capsulimonadaceae bacterium]
MNRGLIRQLAVSLVLLALLSGCARRASNGPSHDNYLRIAATAEPTTLDPAMVEDGPTISLLMQIYEGLVRWTPDNKLAPALATSWDVSKDGCIYTFHLRPGVKFHSGHPVTATDVVYSISRSLAPKTASPVGVTYLGDIVGAQAFNAGKTPTLPGIKALDPLTVQITISKPKAYWINVLTYPTAYVVNAASVARDPAGRITDQNTDGAGPFKLISYKSGVSIELASNASYWDGAPKIAGQHVQIVTDARTRHSLYVHGDLDIVDETSGSREADVKDPALASQIHYFPRAATFYLALNQSAPNGLPAFKDIRVRQALAYATDKKRIVDIVFDGKRDVADDLLPEGLPGYDPNYRGLPYDPAKARALLAAAGYPGGKGFPALPIYYREGNPDYAKLVDQLRQMYQENLGVTVKPQQTELSSLLAGIDNGSYPAYHLRWAADYLDPQDFYSILCRTGSSENHLGYSNAKFDALCDRADVERNAANRMAIYRQAAAILRTDFPRIPLYYQCDVELIKPYVSGIQDGLMGHLPYTALVLKR